MVTIVARLDTESRDRAAQRTDRIVADFHLFNEETRRANCLHAPNATDTFKATNFFAKRANVLSRLQTRSSEACLCRRFFSATQYTCFPALLLSDPLPRRPFPRCAQNSSCRTTLRTSFRLNTWFEAGLTAARSAEWRAPSGRWIPRHEESRHNPVRKWLIHRCLPARLAVGAGDDGCAVGERISISRLQAKATERQRMNSAPRKVFLWKWTSENTQRKRALQTPMSSLRRLSFCSARQPFDDYSQKISHRNICQKGSLR